MGNVRRIAILGATGHVGKCLTAALLETADHEVTGVVRNVGRAQEFLAGFPAGSRCAIASFDEFEQHEFDAIVNCVGVGAPADIASQGAAILSLTEHFDHVVLDYLAGRPGTRCVSLSSGAAYCRDFAEPVSEATPAAAPINWVRSSDFYGLAKLASEARHRAAQHLPIVDFRLFSLFSRNVDIDAGFFMCEVYRAVADGHRLQVGPEDMVRDYIAPQDMAALLLEVFDSAPCNDVIDLYSAAPMAKFDLLDRFSERYGLKYDVVDASSKHSVTGAKPYYYSTNHRAANFGYEPTRTSLQTLEEETDALLNRLPGDYR